MALTTPMIPSKKALEKGLYILYENISSTISFNFDHPLSEQDLRVATENLATYLTHYILRNMRYAKTPLDHANLDFIVRRTRNEKETVLGKDRRPISKGLKEWYYIALTESPGGQILGEGDLRKDKAELLDAFRDMVERRNREWREEDELRHKEWMGKKKLEAEDVKQDEEEAAAYKAIAELEKGEKKRKVRAKGKGRAKRRKVKLGDLVDEADMADE
jgi:hypothetical protein